MHIQGIELISVVTQRSARTLLATSLVVLLAKYFNIPVSEMKILGEQLPIEVFTVGSFIIIVLQSVNHVAHWSGDYFSFQGWNVDEKVNGPALISSGSAIVTRLDAVIHSTELIAKDCKNNLGLDRKGELKHIMDQSDKIVDDLKKIKISAIKLNSYAGFYLYVWQLAFPLVIALAAICWPIPSLQAPT